jgi:hypothetical protein
MEDDKRKRGGSIQHKIFKMIILLIVGVFCYLIVSFLYIDFTKHKSSANHIFELNMEKYNYLYEKDKDSSTSNSNSNSNLNKYTTDNDMNVEICNINKFYSEYISQHKPCIIKLKEGKEYNKYFTNAKTTIGDAKIKSLNPEEELTKLKDSKEVKLNGIMNEIGVLNFAKILDLIDIYFISHTTSSKSIDHIREPHPMLTSKTFMYLQMDGEKTIMLSPITQMKKLFPFKNNTSTSTSTVFNTIYSKENFFELFSRLKDYGRRDQVILLKASLKEGDMLFVPSYYFIHTQVENNKNGVSTTLRYEFKSTSRILDTMFKVLFDDDLSGEGGSTTTSSADI